MTITYDFIHGLSLGIEYVEASDEAGVENGCILLDLLFVRVLIELD